MKLIKMIFFDEQYSLFVNYSELLNLIKKLETIILKKQLIIFVKNGLISNYQKKILILMKQIKKFLIKK